MSDLEELAENRKDERRLGCRMAVRDVEATAHALTLAHAAISRLVTPADPVRVRLYDLMTAVTEFGIGLKKESQP